MNDREFGWVMGLIDGEGSILLGPAGKRRILRIMLPSTDRALLVHLKKLAGGYICARADKRPHVDWAWTWVLSSNQTMELLKKGWDLLRVPQKRNRAKLIIKYWRSSGMSKEEQQKIADKFFAIPDEKWSRKDVSASTARAIGKSRDSKVNIHKTDDLNELISLTRPYNDKRRTET